MKQAKKYVVEVDKGQNHILKAFTVSVAKNGYLILHKLFGDAVSFPKWLSCTEYDKLSLIHI